MIQVDRVNGKRVLGNEGTVERGLDDIFLRAKSIGAPVCLVTHTIFENFGNRKGQRVAVIVHQVPGIPGKLSGYMFKEARRTK